ncbi:hypothetical protein RHMOL_Rhmol13G0151500 [Rhododendron molle]|uniref:Uncharacterized protein n=6 Tax=Rhododendron molle TaxID=49168 RepID=A0ACC0L6X0_RHOML|nr:hypothetical protein RHMOL_Rhmol13G0151500 [Rhododendron molle]KAI8524460.1 hypothetical protein RHMOL_Rhmol13G0151500 [Rhododendron molle]KAI8524463.1 hypothetical protein RHMOL_Rhmol13G0151500 [Rhododendron molle]KAI8524464.1 hypothetical protein RHMOL_Rhmol13G0151500 [Rhododendron molle]KAI8524466.1 hypothetical protein RHMOL_Rhmol13G0151500 [Rhododendron molle]
MERVLILGFCRFQICWAVESKSWLLRALNGSLGGRFLFGGIFKIGNDLSRFVGPVLLNHLLKVSLMTLMQMHNNVRTLLFCYPRGLDFYLHIVDVMNTPMFLCQLACYVNLSIFQNVMRVSFGLRSTLGVALSFSQHHQMTENLTGAANQCRLQKTESQVREQGNIVTDFGKKNWCGVRKYFAGYRFWQVKLVRCSEVSKITVKIDGVKDFTYGELALATNNFDGSAQVGQGGYGKVHRGDKGKLSDMMELLQAFVPAHRVPYFGASRR